MSPPVVHPQATNLAINSLVSALDYQPLIRGSGSIGLSIETPLIELRGMLESLNFSLLMPRRSWPAVEAETLSVEDAMANLKTSLEAAYAAKDRLKALLVKARLMH